MPIASEKRPGRDSESSANSLPAVISHRPLLAIGLAVGLGVAADRLLGVEAEFWWLASAALLGVWWSLWRRGWHAASAVVLLLAVGALGGSWHHLHWRRYDVAEIGLAATEVSSPICLEAVALEGPRLRRAPRTNPMRAIPQGDASLLAIRVLRVRDGERWLPASGDAALTVDGHLLGVAGGETLRIYGNLFKSPPAENPGDFDAALQARSERRLAELRSPFPNCVRTIEPAPWWSWRRRLSELRQAGARQLQTHVGGHRANWAAAILLGLREQVPYEDWDRFRNAGVVHLFAISGLHVGILALGFWWFVRLGVSSRRAALWASIVLVVFYTLLTEARPPVVRAATVVVMLALARLAGRRVLAFNSLAAAGLVVLALNPCDLFNSGAQLSFLAVAVLIVCGSWLLSPVPEDPLDKLILSARPWYWRWSRRAAFSVGATFAVGVALWAILTPLVSRQFHVVSCAGLVLNPLLIPAAGATLLSGFGVLIFGWLFPPLGAACGWLCDGSLWLLEQGVDAANGVEGAYFWSAGPPLWWLGGLYLGGGALIAVGRWRPPLRWCAALFAAWAAVGSVGVALSPLWSPTPPELTCTFTAVGHGAGVVLRNREGKTLLYDAGSLGSPEAAGGAIADVLWSDGVTHIDAVVLSHADADHYNALPTLLERHTVGVIYVSPLMFENTESRALTALRKAIDEAGVPLREIAVGDRLAMGEVTVEVLHPTPKGVLGGDNANSIVLLAEAAGRRILLPGDLEDRGMVDLLAEEPIDCDVVLAPHHGSRRSSVREFAEWTTPEWVVVSGGIASDLDELRETYASRKAEVLHTARDGAVRVRLWHERMEVRAWRAESW